MLVKGTKLHNVIYYIERQNHYGANLDAKYMIVLNQTESQGFRF